jgi:hypothetical protein
MRLKKSSKLDKDQADKNLNKTSAYCGFHEFSFHKFTIQNQGRLEILLPRNRPAWKN